MKNTDLKICVMPGDGIGHEVMDACLPILEAAAAKAGGFSLEFDTHHVGADTYVKTGTALPDSAVEAATAADAILFGAAGNPDIRYPDGREIAPQLDLREHFDLYAGVRPIRAIPGSPGPLASPDAEKIDFVIIRESTEGLFFSRQTGGTKDNQIAEDTMRITRPTSEKLFDFSIALTKRRKQRGGRGYLTCVDKANVLPSMAFFRKIFDERTEGETDLTCDHAYVDAMALNLVRNPWRYDVMVMENMFGDILSDLAAGLVGGMGMAPSGDVGDRYGMFQPSHGSAPDIQGTGKANPTAMFLSAALMLEWLGEKHDLPACETAASLITDAVDAAFEGGQTVPTEFGGNDGTKIIADKVLEHLS